jgi:Winged helix-turn-helix domain (DUF2582)
MEIRVTVEAEARSTEPRCVRVLETNIVNRSQEIVHCFPNREEIKMIQQIGENAGRIWNHLREHPGIQLEQISKELKLKDSLALMAIGWLAREGKLAFKEDGKRPRVSLAAE